MGLHCQGSPSLRRIPVKRLPLVSTCLFSFARWQSLTASPPGPDASPVVLLSSRTSPSRLPRGVDRFSSLHTLQGPDAERKGWLSCRLRGASWCGSPGKPRRSRAGVSSSRCCFQVFVSKTDTRPGCVPWLNLTRKQAALVRILPRTSCCWQSFLLKLKIPFVCGKNLIKEEQPNRNAHWFLFIIGGRNFAQIRLIYEKRANCSEAEASHFLLAFIF